MAATEWVAEMTNTWARIRFQILCFVALWAILGALLVLVSELRGEVAELHDRVRDLENLPAIELDVRDKKVRVRRASDNH